MVPAQGVRLEGLTPVTSLRDADGNRVLAPFPLYEVERPEPAPVKARPEPPGLGLWFWIVAGLIAPFAVLLGALSLPASDPVRGGALAIGWILLGAGARWLDERRRQRR